MKLYPWQEACMKEWELHEFHGIANVVTGAGKTVLALHAIMRLKQHSSLPLRVKIVVPTRALSDQWSAAMMRTLPDLRQCRTSPGRFHGSRKDMPEQDYMIYVVNSARDHLSRHILNDWSQGYDVLLIADECHHYASPENRKIFEFLSVHSIPRRGACYTLGLSATPQCSGFASILVPALGPEIFRYGFTQAVASGTVCPFSVFQIQLTFTAEERREYESYSEKINLSRRKLISLYPFLRDMEHTRFFSTVRQLAQKDADDYTSPASLFLNLTWKRQLLSYLASNRTSCACDLIRRLPSQERIIIFCERIRQADSICTLLRTQYPNQVGLYHSEMSSDSRKQTLELFRSSACRILICCKSLDEGADIPDATVGIILSGTGVSRQHVQRLGRLLRPSPGKYAACLYYLYLKESSEDSAFFPDTEESFRLCNLSYSGTEHSFCHPAYETASVHFLQSRNISSLDHLRQREIRRCLEEGLVRPDWLLPAEECRRKRKEAATQHEKNYWMCMEKLQEYF